MLDISLGGIKLNSRKEDELKRISCGDGIDGECELEYAEEHVRIKQASNDEHALCKGKYCQIHRHLLGDIVFALVHFMETH